MTTGSLAGLEDFVAVYFFFSFVSFGSIFLVVVVIVVVVVFVVLTAISLAKAEFPAYDMVDPTVVAPVIQLKIKRRRTRKTQSEHGHTTIPRGDH
jgi:membrane-associated HD superfamily phosphohydrolase